VPTEEEVSQIIELWNLGKSYGDIAKHLNGKKSTVQKWIEGLIKGGEIEPRTNGVRINTKNATNANKTYNRERRLALNDMFFEKIETLLKDSQDPTIIRTLAVPYGIACDKREKLEPNEGSKTGLEEMREAIRKERNVEASSS
jgi:transposase